MGTIYINSLPLNGGFIPDVQVTEIGEEYIRKLSAGEWEGTATIDPETAIKIRSMAIRDVFSKFWVPVSQGFPEDDQTVLTCTADGHLEIATWEKERRWWWFEEGWRSADRTDEYRTVAWMSLPEPYKEEE
jgi:hypothetical protein